MAKGIFIGVNNTARKVTKAYVGVSNTARKIKAAYIGVNGVARQVYSAEKKVVYVGGITSLSNSRSSLAAASNSAYSLFGGGGFNDIVDAYNSNLSRSTPTELSSKRSDLAAVSNGSYILFGGGLTSSMGATNTVDAYDIFLTRSVASGLYTSRTGLSAAYNGTYMIFAGGESPTIVNSIDAYSSSLVRTNTPTLSSARSYMMGGRAGNYALFGGGLNTTNAAINTVDAFSQSLTRSTLTGLNGSSAFGAAANLGSSLIIGGGASGTWGNYTSLPYTTGYNSSLSAFYPGDLSYSRMFLAASGTDTHAYFGGGRNIYDVNNEVRYNLVDVFDASYTRQTMNLSEGRSSLAATTRTKYDGSEVVLFGGGTSSGASVDGFTFA